MMDQNNKAEFEIQVSIADSTEEELDRSTRQLLSELKELDIDSAELAEGTSIPEGAKGDPITIGSIVIATLPAVLPKVVELVQAWGSHGQGRTVKFKGRGIEFEGSPEDLQRLLTKLDKEKKRK
jgi:hypothetical protein